MIFSKVDLPGAVRADQAGAFAFEEADGQPGEQGVLVYALAIALLDENIGRHRTLRDRVAPWMKGPSSSRRRSCSLSPPGVAGVTHNQEKRERIEVVRQNVNAARERRGLGRSGAPSVGRDRPASDCLWARMACATKRPTSGSGSVQRQSTRSAVAQMS